MAARTRSRSYSNVGVPVVTLIGAGPRAAACTPGRRGRSATSCPFRARTRPDAVRRRSVRWDPRLRNHARHFTRQVDGQRWLDEATASLLIASGANVKVVQPRLRHASATTTLDTYGHLFPDSDEATRTAVETVLVARADSLRTGEVII